MIIEINRVYVGTGMLAKILVNTNYIIKMEPADDPDKPATRIIYDALSSRQEGPNIMYTNDSIKAIKTRINKQKKLESDG